MVDYFRLVSEELLIKLNQVKIFIKRHNPTIGILTEEILRSFLKIYLPQGVNVEQGFILSCNGEMSKQCDILIYDCQLYAPYYRTNDIVVVPSNSVIAVIEVKTTINKKFFHGVIDYFANIKMLCNAKTYLFIYKSVKISKMEDYLKTFKHKGEYQSFDHDTFQLLPDEITGISRSYHLIKDVIVLNSDIIGYSSYSYENEKQTEISAFEIFFSSVYRLIIEYNKNKLPKGFKLEVEDQYQEKRRLKSYTAIELFSM